MKKNNMLKLLGIAFVVAIASTGIFYGLFVNKLSSSTGSGGAALAGALFGIAVLGRRRSRRAGTSPSRAS